MSTNTNTNTRPSKGDDISFVDELLKFLAEISIKIWFEDTPGHVAAYAEPRFRPGVLRFAVGLWTVLALFGGLEFPFVGLFLCLPVGILIARRICAETAIPLPMRSLVAAAGEMSPWALPGWGLIIAWPALAHIWHPGGVIGFALAVFARMSDVSLLLAPVAVARVYRDEQFKIATERRAVATGLSTIFQVAQSVVDEESMFDFDQISGEVMIRPVPPAMAVRLADRAALDARIAAIWPGMITSADASASMIHIINETPEQRARREALLASGGLLASEPEREDDTRQRPMVLEITAEDLA